MKRQMSFPDPPPRQQGPPCRTCGGATTPPPGQPPCSPDSADCSGIPCLWPSKPPPDLDDFGEEPPSTRGHRSHSRNTL